MERAFKHKGVILGLFVGPFVASEFMAILHYHNGRPDLPLAEYLLYSPLLATNYFIVMLPIAFVAGIPAYFALLRFRLLSGVSVASYGATVGAIVAWLLTDGSLHAYVTFTGGGLMSAIIAWIVIKIRSNTSLKSDCTAL